MQLLIYTSDYLIWSGKVDLASLIKGTKFFTLGLAKSSLPLLTVIYDIQEIDFFTSERDSNLRLKLFSRCDFMNDTS